MGTLTQTVLPFKAGTTEEMLAANAGLALLGECMQGLGLHRWLVQERPLPGSGRGYKANAYMKPLVPMSAGGGRLLEDLRTLKADTALSALFELDILPGSSNPTSPGIPWTAMHPGLSPRRRQPNSSTRANGATCPCLF